MLQAITEFRHFLIAARQHSKVKVIFSFWPVFTLFFTFFVAYLLLSPVINYPFTLFGDSFLTENSSHFFSTSLVRSVLKFFLPPLSDSPFYARALILSFHLFNGVLVFLLAQQFAKLKGGTTFFPAYCAFLFFVFSPLAVQNIVWISTIHETLSVTIILLALYFYLKFLHLERFIFYGGIVFLQILLVFIGPYCLALPFLMLGISLCGFNKSRSHILLLALSILLIPLIYYNLNTDFSSWFSELKKYDLKFTQAILLRFLVIGFYFKSLFIPGERHLDYNWDLSNLGHREGDFSSMVFAGLLFLSFFVFIFIKKSRFFLYFLVAFLFAILFDLRFLMLRYEGYPNSFGSIIIRSFVADRYLYLPLALFFAFLFPLVLKGFKQNRFLFFFLPSVGVLLLLSFFHQNEQRESWQSNITLIKRSFNLSYLPYESLIRLGDTFDSSEERFYANVFFEEAHLRFPEKDFPIEKLINYYNENQIYDRAEFLFFEQLKSSRPLNVGIFRNMAEASISSDDILLAEKILLVGLTFYKEDKELLTHFASVWNRKKEMQRDAFETLGHYAAFNNDFQSAQKYLIEAFELDPKNERLNENIRIFKNTIENKQKMDQFKKAEEAQKKIKR